VRNSGAARRSQARTIEYRYFIDIAERLQKVHAEQLRENSVCSATQGITDTLKEVEAAGFGEVILYFNVGMKPHQQ
jgi:hypothetical protein